MPTIEERWEATFALSQDVGEEANPDLVTFQLSVDKMCVLLDLLDCELASREERRHIPEEAETMALIYDTVSIALDDYLYADEPEDS